MSDRTETCSHAERYRIGEKAYRDECPSPAVCTTTQGMVGRRYCHEHGMLALIAGFAPKWDEPVPTTSL